jgi:lysophospholipase L1-like esterase
MKDYLHCLPHFLAKIIFACRKPKSIRPFAGLLCFTFFINSTSINAQDKRLVAIGSSSTAGYCASSKDSCWVSMLNNYYKCRLNIIDSAYNLGVMGTTNYQAMPSGYTPPPSRPSPDVAHNVSKAVSILSNLSNTANGVVIVNFPTNGYINYSIAEIMNSLQTIFDSVTVTGSRCYITTTQPRCDAGYNTAAVKKKLADIKDSILNRFDNNAINFWDGMFNSADTTIQTGYSCGDFIHFNNTGHRVLFERVIAKNIFGLPVWYSKANGNLEDLTTWGSNPDGSGTSPSSFATDNQLFNIVNNSSPLIGGDWILSGKNTQIIIGDGVTPVHLIIPANVKVSITGSAAGSCY